MPILQLRFNSSSICMNLKQRQEVERVTVRWKPADSCSLTTRCSETSKLPAPRKGAPVEVVLAGAERRRPGRTRNWIPRHPRHGRASGRKQGCRVCRPGHVARHAAPCRCGALLRQQQRLRPSRVPANNEHGCGASRNAGTTVLFSDHESLFTDATPRLSQAKLLCLGLILG